MHLDSIIFLFLSIRPPSSLFSTFSPFLLASTLKPRSLPTHHQPTNQPKPPGQGRGQPRARGRHGLPSLQRRPRRGQAGLAPQHQPDARRRPRRGPRRRRSQLLLPVPGRVRLQGPDPVLALSLRHHPPRERGGRRGVPEEEARRGGARLLAGVDGGPGFEEPPGRDQAQAAQGDLLDDAGARGGAAGPAPGREEGEGQGREGGGWRGRWGRGRWRRRAEHLWRRLCRRGQQQRRRGPGRRR